MEMKDEVKSHLAVYLLTPHCQVIKMSKWRFGVPDFIYFLLNSNVFPGVPGLCITISRYLAINFSYHNLFNKFFLAVAYGENFVKRGMITMEVKLDMSRDEIVKKISNLMIRISTLKEYVFKMREILYFMFPC